MRFLDYLFHGKELKAIGNYFKMLNGYSPIFTSFSGGVYEMDLTRTAVNNFATHCSKLKPEIEGSALKTLEKTLQHKPNYFMDTTKFIKRLATYVAVEHTAIETDANQLAHIKGGASLEYTAETYTAKDDLGVVQKTILTSEDVTLKAGLLTWCAKTLEKLCATARVTETAKKRTVKIGGIKNQNHKKYLIRFLHEDSEDGNIRVTIVGRNEAGFSFTFAKDAESTIEPQFKAHPMDKDGTLLIFDEDIVTEA